MSATCPVHEFLMQLLHGAAPGVHRDTLPELVRFGLGYAEQYGDDLHDLLLKDNAAVCFGKDRYKRRVDHIDPHPAVTTGGEALHHVALNWAGPDERD